MLELMLDERRTFTVEPVAFLERFMLHVGPSPISASLGGFESPIEMYAAAVLHSLGKRAGGLEQGVKQTERAYDASKLWRWQLLPMKHIHDIAAVLHDHEGGGEDERADSIEVRALDSGRIDMEPPHQKLFSSRFTRRCFPHRSIS